MNEPFLTLNLRQREAARGADGRCIVAAGPGTGKTTALAHRLAHLLTEKAIPGRSVLAVTFTRGAAQEMRKRVGALLAGKKEEKELQDLWIETFHAAALRLLREQEYPFGPGAEWSVLAEEERHAILDGLIEARNAPDFLAEMRRRKQSFLPPEGGPQQEYQRRLAAARRLDFDDLFVYACRLFEEKPETLELYRARFRYVLVDEFQDTSSAQYRFLSRLAGEHLCVLGDPDQAIYGFQGDGFAPFEQFKRDFPSHRLLSLSENYRSQGAILEAAKQVIGKNRAQLPRELEARLEQGLPLEITPYQTDAQEAEMVARRIEGLIGGSSGFAIDSRWAAKEGETYSYGLGDIAVLARFHAQIRLVEKVLERSGLPYRSFGKRSKKSDPQISAEEGLERFQNDPAGLQGEGIALMTLHRSKGLEFPVVFILGCEDQVLPYYRSETAEGRGREMEEERRLFYVGMTRAKNRLFLSHARSRFLFGRRLEAGPSPFLKEMEEALCILREGWSPQKKKPAKPDQLSLF